MSTLRMGSKWVLFLSRRSGKPLSKEGSGKEGHILIQGQCRVWPGNTKPQRTLEDLKEHQCG